MPVPRRRVPFRSPGPQPWGTRFRNEPKRSAQGHASPSGTGPAADRHWEPRHKGAVSAPPPSAAELYAGGRGGRPRGLPGGRRRRVSRAHHHAAGRSAAPGRQRPAAEDRGKRLPSRGCRLASPKAAPAAARTPPPRLPGEGGGHPPSGVSHRGRGGRRAEEAWPGPPSPASAGPARAPSPGCARGPLAAMTAPGGPAGLQPRGRGPGGDPEGGGPPIRDPLAEGALPPGGNWTLTGRPRPPGRGPSGLLHDEEALGPPPFPALPARQP